MKKCEKHICMHDRGELNNVSDWIWCAYVVHLQRHAKELGFNFHYEQ